MEELEARKYYLQNHGAGKWGLARINQTWKMTRIEGQYIATRDLTLWEKIRYFRKLKRVDYRDKFAQSKHE